MFVGKVSSLTLLFKSTYFAWEYILLFVCLPYDNINLQNAGCFSVTIFERTFYTGCVRVYQLW